MTHRHERGAASPMGGKAAPARLRAPILEALARHATVGLFLAEPGGHVHYVNREACRILGLPRARALGDGWSEALHAEDRARVLRRRARALARGMVFRARMRFVHRDGAMVVTADLLSVPVRDRGRPLGRAGMLVEVPERVTASTISPDAPAGRRWDDLSRQERRVLQLVVEGRTNKAIAAALGLSAKTVKNYLSSAFQKLHVERRSQAAAVFARRSGDPPGSPSG